MNANSQLTIPSFPAPKLVKKPAGIKSINEEGISSHKHPSKVSACIPSLSVSPSGLCLYDTYVANFDRPPKMPTKNTHDLAVMSKRQQVRIKKAINWLYLVSTTKSVLNQSTGRYSRFRINFITLTLSSKQVHTDKEILKQCFEPFIRKLRDGNKGLLYVWKSEVQDNGNIHFHVNTNIFIHHKVLRDLWNECQNKLGYVDRCSVDNPNSTDVSAVKNDKQLGSYMAGYIGKKDLYKKPLKIWHRRYDKKFLAEKERCDLPRNYFLNLKRAVEIKLWDCSLALKKIKISLVDYSSSINSEILEIISDAPVFSGDYFDYYSGVDWFNMPNCSLKLFVLDKLSAIRKHVSQMPDLFTWSGC